VLCILDQKEARRLADITEAPTVRVIMMLVRGRLPCLLCLAAAVAARLLPVLGRRRRVGGGTGVVRAFSPPSARLRRWPPPAAAQQYTGGVMWGSQSSRKTNIMEKGKCRQQRRRVAGRLQSSSDVSDSFKDNDTGEDGRAVVSADFDSTTKTTAEGDSAEGDLCLLPWGDDEDDYSGEFVSKTTTAAEKTERRQLLVSRALQWVPVVVPIAAYFSYEGVALVADAVTELLSSNNFVEVDGGNFKAQVIAPAINGVVMPACAVTFATLLSITVSTLRQRQQDIRATINMEAGELRSLQVIVDKAFPAGSAQQNRCRSYLVQYTSRLISESQPTTQLDALEASAAGESEMNGFLDQLIELNKNEGAVSGPILSESFAAVARLNSERSTRISALQASFPALHYAILGVLAISMCFCFLLETNQDLVIFLGAVQLKLLWSVLVGVFSGFAVVCYDLKDPFQGLYQITKSVKQIYTIREVLRASACDAIED